MGGNEGHYNGMPAGAVESEYPWVKSSRSQGSGMCVEMRALADGRIAVRNSVHPDGPALLFTAAEVSAWVGGAKDGEFDRLTS